MNAKEAGGKAIESAQSEIEQVKSSIEAAVKEGKMSVTLGLPYKRRYYGGVVNEKRIFFSRFEREFKTSISW